MDEKGTQKKALHENNVNENSPNKSSSNENSLHESRLHKNNLLENNLHESSLNENNPHENSLNEKITYDKNLCNKNPEKNNLHGKDILEKTLEAYNDVFADIVNVLLFKGKQTMRPEDITDASEISIIKTDASEHTQERDIAKYWIDKTNGEAIRIALVGLENQSSIDRDMVLRTLCYDAAEYRKQIIDKNSKMRYPIVTLVLYFGNRRWKAPRSLREYFGLEESSEYTSSGCDRVKELRRSMAEYIGDYRINVFEIAYLSDEEVAMFKSDFRIVADYFVQVRKNRNYKPSEEKIKHVYAVLELMKTLTGDKRFTLPYEKFKEGDVTNMSKALTKYFKELEKEAYERGEEEGEARGESRGKEIGIAEGEARGKIIGIRQSKTEIAKNLHRNGMDIETIAKMVDCDIATVKEWLSINI